MPGQINEWQYQGALESQFHAFICLTWVQDVSNYILTCFVNSQLNITFLNSDYDNEKHVLVSYDYHHLPISTHIHFRWFNSITPNNFQQHHRSSSGRLRLTNAEKSKALKTPRLK